METDLSKKLLLLHPILRTHVPIVLSKLEAAGAPSILFSGYRSFEEQDGLYALGRTVKNSDGATESKPLGNIITNARGGDSKHNYGIAVDIVRLDKNGRPTWDLPFSKIGEIGKAEGFEWGGDWENFKDLPHLQMSFGMKLAEMRAITLKDGLLALWDKFDQIYYSAKPKAV